MPYLPIAEVFEQYQQTGNQWQKFKCNYTIYLMFKSGPENLPQAFDNFECYLKFNMAFSLTV